MPTGFSFDYLDTIAFAAYFVVLCFVGLWAGRKEKADADDYFLAGRTLPWYVVGSSFIASNISTEHFIGMVGAAFLFGICVAMSEWMNVLSFSVMIWLFIPFLLASKVFTTPEFMEKRFNFTLRMFFAVVTVISNVVAFLAAVLYGGGLALEKLFGEFISRMTTPMAEWVHGSAALTPALMDKWNLWFAIIALGVVAGSWAIYGGLSSVAWTDFFTIIVMVAGGLMVTILGLYSIAPEGGGLIDGFRVMIDRNQAHESPWRDYVQNNLQQFSGEKSYNRLAVIQPVTHVTTPWPSLIFGLFSISIWYNVINQFMIQRVLGAKDMYHARMGIVLAGYMKILMPVIVVLPGLILFARATDLLPMPFSDIKVQADQGYVRLLKTLIPAGFRGLFLAALFGAIQSTVNSVLNSTATVFTLDIYDRLLVGRRPTPAGGPAFPVVTVAGESAAAPVATGDQAANSIESRHQKRLVRMGMYSSIVVLLIAIVLAGFISEFEDGNLFVYIQTLYAFFAPPFSAVFVLGILFRRINGTGATVAVAFGFLFGMAMKWFVGAYPDAAPWIVPFANQAIVNWAACTLICIVVSLLTAPPRPDQVTDQLTINWSRLNIFSGLGGHWYSSVVLWWGLFVAVVLGLIVLFSGRFM